MKKWSMAFILLPLLISGCGSSSQTQTANKPKLVFRLANELKPDSRIWEASNLFRNELIKESPDGEIKAGEIDVVFFDQGTVGSERQLLESCYFDVLEMVQVNSSIVTTLDPAYNILDLPYIFVSEDQHHNVIYGDLGRKFLNRLEKYKLVGLGFYGTGFRNLFYNQKEKVEEITGPKDLRGLKIRVMESPIMINSINAIGTTAVAIPFSELFTSIRTGVVDGAENSARIFMSYSYYEAGCNQFTLTEHFANQHIIIANSRWFSSLEPKYQKRIKEVIALSQSQFDDIWATTTEESMADMQKHNVKINVVKDKSLFIESTSDVINQFVNDYPKEAEELLDDVIRTRDAYVKPGGDEGDEPVASETGIQ
jgi:tripartite ATP-independent transporter DctP family solute receptor